MNNRVYVVRGTLAIVLGCCRVFGTAPLLYEKLENGYKVTVSNKYAIYSYILITFSNTNFLMGFVNDLVKRAVKAKTLLNMAFVIPDALTAMCSAALASYYGVPRMNKMIMRLNRLNKAKVNINAIRNHETSKDNVKLALFICYMVPIIIFQSMEVRNLCVNYYTSEKLITINYAIFTISYLAMNLFEVLSILLLLEIQLALRAINTEIKTMLATNAVGNLTEIYSKKIHDLSHAYVTVCEVMWQMNESDGVAIFIIFANFIITLVTSLYYGFQLLTVLPSSYVFMQNIWCVMYAIMVITFIETCHYIQNEVQYLKINLGKLMNKLTSVGWPLQIDMDILYKQLIMNKLTYTPMAMFTLRRSLILTFFSAVITYILFMVQMKL